MYEIYFILLFDQFFSFLLISIIYTHMNVYIIRTKGSSASQGYAKWCQKVIHRNGIVYPLNIHDTFLFLHTFLFLIC